jgi:hypothetical protein
LNNQALLKTKLNQASARFNQVIRPFKNLYGIHDNQTLKTSFRPLFLKTTF